MKLITQYELTNRPTSELRGLLRQTFDALAQSKPESEECRAALASLENIQAELGVRIGGPEAPPSEPAPDQRVNRF